MSTVTASKRQFNPTSFEGDHLNHVAFPLGGIGAGMICLEGSGSFTHVSMRHKPDVFHEPAIFGAITIKGGESRVLEGPVPLRKAYSHPGHGEPGAIYGLPRFRKASFTSLFPFGTVRLSDMDLPVDVELTAWSPFIPGNADDSSLPMAVLEYTFCNRTRQDLSAVFSFHAANFMRWDQKCVGEIRPVRDGFVLYQPPLADKPWAEGNFAVIAPEASPRVDCAWFRGGFSDPLNMVWRNLAGGQARARKPHQGAAGNGGSLYVPFNLKPGARRIVRVLLAWYVPKSDIRTGPTLGKKTADCACQGKSCGSDAESNFIPWYASRFASIKEVLSYWQREGERLRAESARFRDCFFDTTLPREAIEAAAANLAILKSPTCLRQSDGRFWAWEGCCDGEGCCHGSCTHVWNYAQAMPHLFPDLERSLRETEFNICQDRHGHQNFRTSLPIRPSDHKFHAAADGQLGGIVRTYREWRISGDTVWLRAFWPRIKKSLDYCIEMWDPEHKGLIIEPHHNTYDIEFWGPDSMCCSIYLAALQAAEIMGQACDADVKNYTDLYARGRKTMERLLWNGAYFDQKVQWKGMRAGDPTRLQMIGPGYSAEARAILRREGPKNQYGPGCLADGVIGDWLAHCAGLDRVIDPQKTAAHLAAVYRHNFHANLSKHVNANRPQFAMGADAGLLLCSWPRGGKPSLSFHFSDEVWTGIEYQVAAHLISFGHIKEGLSIVRAVRKRHDGQWRNPFDEYECGHWYARAMSSYSLLQALSGARYDAVEKTLYLAPAVKGDFRAFLCTATGYGTVGRRNGKSFVEVRSGRIDVRQILEK